MTASAPDGRGFAQDLERLEEIVRRLEGDALDLDDALRLFEEGVERLRAARERLSVAELRVKQVLGTQAGRLQLGDIDR